MLVSRIAPARSEARLIRGLPAWVVLTGGCARLRAGLYASARFASSPFWWATAFGLRLIRRGPKSPSSVRSVQDLLQPICQFQRHVCQPRSIHEPDAAMKSAFQKVGSQILEEWLKKAGPEGQQLIKTYRGK